MRGILTGVWRWGIALGALAVGLGFWGIILLSFQEIVDASYCTPVQPNYPAIDRVCTIDPALEERIILLFIGAPT
jgi:hypothetical protein